MITKRCGWLALCASLCLLPGPAAANSETIGDVVTGLLGMGAIGTTYAYDDKDGRWMLIKSTAVSYTTNGLLRLAFNDSSLGERPNGGPYGFPSGHAGFMAANAGFLQERYGWKLGVPAWLATGYVSYVRVEQTGHHRWRDIIAAVAIAQGIACWMVDPYEERHAQLEPMLDPDALGMRITYVW